MLIFLLYTSAKFLHVTYHSFLFGVFSVPTPPTNFKPLCNLVSWKAPLDSQGILSGFEINIKSSTNPGETKYLGPTDFLYETKEYQNKNDAKIRVSVK